MAEILKKLKNSINEGLGNETIGTLGFEDLGSEYQKLQEQEARSKPEPKPKRTKPTVNTKEEKATKPKQEKPSKAAKERSSPMKSIVGSIIPQVSDYTDIDNDNNTGEKSYPVLSFLNIPRRIKLGNLITPDDIENVEFSLTSPTGANPNEVEAFLNKVQKDLSKLYRAVEKRESEFDKLLIEVDKVQSQLIEIRQQKEMDAILGNDKTEVDKLKDEVLNLQLENTHLRAEVTKLESSLREEKAKAIAPKPKQQPTKPILIDDENRGLSNEDLGDSFDLLLSDLKR